VSKEDLRVEGKRFTLKGTLDQQGKEFFNKRRKLEKIEPS